MFPARVRFALGLSVFAVWFGFHDPGSARQRGAPPGSAAGTQTQPVPTGITAISGRVVDGATGAPIAGAVVALASAGDPMGDRAAATTERQATDPTGRFLFAPMSTARPYQLLATKPGYFDGAFGVDATHGTPQRVRLAEGQWLPDATIKLWKPSAVSGTITDEFGDPIVGAYVAVVARILVAGVPQFASGPLTRTDDRGAYRIAPLTAGTFAVVVPSIQVAVPTNTPDERNLSSTQYAVRDGANFLVLGAGSLVPPSVRADGRRQGYAATFYPGVRSLAGATTIELAPGEDRVGIDVQLQAVPVSRISGRLDGPSAAVANRRLRLMPAGSENMGIGHEAAIALARADGSFAFVDVPDGQYTILAASGAPGYDYVSPGTVIIPSLHSAAGLGGPFAIRGTTGGVLATAATVRRGAATGVTGVIRSSTFGLNGNDAFVGRTPVEVAGADRSDIVVRLQQGVTISGRFVIDTPQDRAALAALTPYVEVAADPAGAEPWLRAVRGGAEPLDPTLDFALADVLPGDYVLRMFGSAGMIKSVTWSGRDYTGKSFTVADQNLSGLVVTITSQVARVHGVVRDAQGRLATQATVIRYPVEPSQWQRYGGQPERLRSVPVTQIGTYEFGPMAAESGSMPAGDYYLLAVEEGLADRWKDPAFLEAGARLATRVTIDWGETKIQNLTMAGVP